MEDLASLADATVDLDEQAVIRESAITGLTGAVYPAADLSGSGLSMSDLGSSANAADGDLMFRRVARCYARALQVCIEPYGVTSGMWYYLRALWDEDGITQRELSERVETMEPTTATALRVMEERGLVTRRRNALDKRKLNIFLTAKGGALRDILLPQVAALTRRGLAGLDRQRVAALTETIGAVQYNLQREVAADAGLLGDF